MFNIARKKIIIFGAVFGLLILLHFTKVLLPFESVALNVFKPILSGFYSSSVNIKNYFSQQSEKRDLYNINKQLESQINQLTVENAKLKLLEEENKILRDYLNFYTKNPAKYVLGNVISRGDLNSGEQSLIIDKGANDKITVGLPVVSSFGIIVGKVASVKDSLSEIYLLTNPKCKFASSIQNSTKTTGVVQGELGLTVKMGFIPQTEILNEGDTVITSGLEQNISRGFVIGKVSKVNKESNELWQTAMIEPLVSPNSLVVVSVILPGLE